MLYQILFLIPLLILNASSQDSNLFAGAEVSDSSNSNIYNAENIGSGQASVYSETINGNQSFISENIGSGQASFYSDVVFSYSNSTQIQSDGVYKLKVNQDFAIGKGNDFDSYRVITDNHGNSILYSKNGTTFLINNQTQIIDSSIYPSNVGVNNADILNSQSSDGSIKILEDLPHYEIRIYSGITKIQTITNLDSYFFDSWHGAVSPDGNTIVILGVNKASTGLHYQMYQK